MLRSKTRHEFAIPNIYIEFEVIIPQPYTLLHDD